MAIGSFPHAAPGPALELIEKYLPHAPACPQLLASLEHLGELDFDRR